MSERSVDAQVMCHAKTAVLQRAVVSFCSRLKSAGEHMTLRRAVLRFWP